MIHYFVPDFISRKWWIRVQNGKPENSMKFSSFHQLPFHVSIFYIHLLIAYVFIRFTCTVYIVKIFECAMWWAFIPGRILPVLYRFTFGYAIWIQTKWYMGLYGNCVELNIWWDIHSHPNSNRVGKRPVLKVFLFGKLLISYSFQKNGIPRKME